MKAQDIKTFGKQVSDGFMPDFLKIILYKKLIGIGPAHINGWSFMHLLSGIIVGLLKFNALPAFIIHTIWEIFQASVGDNKLDLETAIDVPLDTLFFMFGWFLARKWF